MLGKTEGRRRKDDRGWDGWMASPTWWTWVGVNSGSWCWTGSPGVLEFTGSQRVGHAERLSWPEHCAVCVYPTSSLSTSLLTFRLPSWLAIEHHAAVGTGIRAAFKITFSLRTCPEVGLLGHWVFLYLEIFWSLIQPAYSLVYSGFLFIQSW